MEIEKKYTVKKLPDNLDSYSCKIIEQAYLNVSPAVRIRRSNDNYSLTYKGSGLMAREEYNLTLDKESYEHLLKKADGTIISKKDILFLLSILFLMIAATLLSCLNFLLNLMFLIRPLPRLLLRKLNFPVLNWQMRLSHLNGLTKK